MPGPRAATVLGVALAAPLGLAAVAAMAAHGAAAPAEAEAGEPVKVAETTYRTSASATADRAERIRSYERLMGVVLVGNRIAVGLAVGAVGTGLGTAWFRRRVRAAGSQWGDRR